MKKLCKRESSRAHLWLAGILLFLAAILSPIGMGQLNANNTRNLVQETEQDKGQVKGVILDEQAQPLIGVSISIEGTTTGVLSDLDGKFAINVETGQTLDFSYIGFKTRKIKIANFNELKIVLNESDIALSEVVVTALGIKREQKALSYNVQEIKGDALLGVKDANMMNSLAGKVAGVNINTAATGIGGATRVVMRGAKSITKDNNALYVIDGVPIFNNNMGAPEDQNEYADQPGGEGISDFNPEDIESISVLTGPSAAALYGANAANGAVIITTKKGTSGTPKVTVTHQSTFSKPFILPKFQNKYGNLTDVFRSWGEEQNTYRHNPKDFFETGTTHQTNASISVGSDANQTYASLGTTFGDGIVPNNEYNKYNVTLRNTTKFLNDKMTLDFGFSYIKQKDKNMLSSGQYFNPLTAVYLYPRGENFNDVKTFETWDDVTHLMTQNWDWGNQNLDLQNPYWIQNRNQRTNKRDRYMGNASLSYDALDWLNLLGRARIDHSYNKYEMKNFATTPLLHAPEFGRYKYIDEATKQIYADFLVNIHKYFGDYSLSANIGTSISDMQVQGRGADAGLLIPNFFAATNLDFNDPKKELIHDGWRQQTQSIFANVEIGWKSMLYLTLTGRNDWDSALANTDNKSFFYPSVGLSAVISEMVKMPDAISYLQLRASYASVGSPIPRHLSIPTYEKDAQSGHWQPIAHMPISSLKPERTGSWEIGLSSKFGGNKLTFDMTWYKSNTKNQTFNMPISASSGFESMYIQTGNVQNMGWEFAIGTNHKWADWSWSGTFTASTNKNKIKEMVKNNTFFDPQGNPLSLKEMSQKGIGSAEFILTQGGTMGDLYVKQELAKNDDGSYKLSDGGAPVLKGTKELVGSVLPKWNIGFRNDFRWKDVTMGFMLSGRFGGVVISPTEAILDGFGVSKRSQLARDNGGVVMDDGTVFDAEDYYRVTGNANGLLGDYVYSANNIRLQELTVGYHLPKKWVNNIANIHVSFVGRNLWMIHKKAPFDPETTASTGTYFQGIDYFMQPSLRSMGFSVRVQF